MCTVSNCFSSLFFTAFLIFIMCIGVLNGHPLKPHQAQLMSNDDEHDTDDILAGAEFLSLFMHSTRLRESMTTTTTTDIPTTIATNNNNNLLSDDDDENDVSNLIRTSRSVLEENESSTVVVLDNFTSDLENNNSNDNNKIINNNNYEVLKVRVSTSISTNQNPNFDNSAQQTSNEPEVVASSAKKSEFPVEESEPITRNHDDSSDLLTSEFARPFNLPTFQHKPYQTVIYHDSQDGNVADANRARSVSYSTVIRQLPKSSAPKTAATAESNFYVVTMKPPDGTDNNNNDNNNNNNNNKNNNKSDLKAISSSSAQQHWKPKIYGEPEKNYEIDEAVNVKSNGRAHGVVSVNKPAPSNGDNEEQNKNKDNNNEDDDNQKVGYVVEGRNFRKYRVEERTPDGFIVGEYGVVSHDDGSLRGVRYTADGTINPRLIYDALMKFLSL